MGFTLMLELRLAGNYLIMQTTRPGDASVRGSSSIILIAAMLSNFRRTLSRLKKDISTTEWRGLNFNFSIFKQGFWTPAGLKPHLAGCALFQRIYLGCVTAILVGTSKRWLTVKVFRETLESLLPILNALRVLGLRALDSGPQEYALD